VTLRVKALIFTKGSQIMADGLETDPIVFSSNRGVKKKEEIGWNCITW
jgi:hypothetical protein